MRATHTIALLILIICTGCFGGDDEGCNPACSAGFTCTDGACVADGEQPGGQSLDGHQYGTGEVIATAEFGTLKKSSADAFIEAFEFVLSYLSGKTIAFGCGSFQSTLLTALR